MNNQRALFFSLMILGLLLSTALPGLNTRAQEKPTILKRKTAPAPLQDAGTNLRLSVAAGKPGAFTPELALLGAVDKTINGKPFIWTTFAILNWNKFSPELFKPAPALPPCGKNSNSARTWLSIYNADNNSFIYGYCSLKSPADLKDFGFATADSQLPPKLVYVVLTDRQTNTTYKSNCINAWSGLQCGKP